MSQLCSSSTILCACDSLALTDVNHLVRKIWSFVHVLVIIQWGTDLLMPEQYFGNSNINNIITTNK